MNWFVENWYVLLGFVAVASACTYAVYKFLHLPTKEQIKNIKEWLKYAVLEAEKELKGGTGQAKLRLVYDMAIAKFSWLSFISFDTFSKWVDEALVWLNEQLESNENIKDYVGN